MNDDLHSLQLLLAHAEKQRDETLAEQLRLEAARSSAEAQAAQLVVYRGEYEARWQTEFSREGKMELVHCYQGFVQRLSQAVEQQQRVAQHAAMQVERAVAIVRGHEIRVAGLKKMIERRAREGQRADAVQEQKHSDEHAARAAWMRLAEANARRAA